MSSIQINNGADPVGKVSYEAATESVLFEAFNGKSITLRTSGDVRIEGDTKIEGNTDVPPPIQSGYIQFPGLPEPGSLWPDTVWEKRFDDSYGLFFRTEGSNALAFGGGEQGWHVHSHEHGVPLNNYDYSGSSQGAYPSSGAYASSTGVVRSAWGTDNYGTSETRPRNVTIRVWERVA